MATIKKNLVFVYIFQGNHPWFFVFKTDFESPITKFNLLFYQAVLLMCATVSDTRRTTGRPASWNPSQCFEQAFIQIPEDLCAIDVDNRPIHLLKENVFIRLATRQLLDELGEYREIGMVERDIVFEFYRAASKYAALKLPFVDAVHKNSKFLNFPQGKRVQLSQ